MSQLLFFPSVANLSIYSTRFQEALEGKIPIPTVDSGSTSASKISSTSVSSKDSLSAHLDGSPPPSDSNAFPRNSSGVNTNEGKTASSSSASAPGTSSSRRHFTHRREELRHRKEKEAAFSSSTQPMEARRVEENVKRETSTPTPTSSGPVTGPKNGTMGNEFASFTSGSSPSSPASDTSSSFDPLSTKTETFPVTLAGPSPSTRSSSSSSPSGPPRYYFCDVCSQGCFASFEDAETHLLENHVSHLPDYQLLRTVVRKLLNRDVWLAVKEEKRKDGTLEACGRRVLEEGRRKDPGPERMLEAHRAREQLEAVVQQWHPTAKVYIFGSSVTFGIWDGMGDIDFTVVDEAQLRAGTWPPPERNAVRSITELLRRAGFSYVNLEPISHARVPIIKHHASFPLRLEPSVVRRSKEAVVVEGTKEEEECNASTPCRTPQPPSEKEIAIAHLDKETTVAKGINRKEEAKDGSAQEGQRVDVKNAARDLRVSLSRRLEAEDVIARSVRYILNGPASWEDRLLLEASIREAVGATGVQQVWWNRTRDLMNVTLDTTTNAIRAATCPLAVVSPTLRARIQPLHDDCRPELYNLDFDLSFRVFGIRNSQLLRRYLMQHPCARPGAMILKEWSKRSGVNNSVNGFLTSYAVAIMWLYFLLQKRVVKFVDPVKDIPASLEGCPMNPVYVPMVDPKWTKEEQTLYATQGGDLLVEFFYFYAVEFDWKNHVVSLNRPGITTKSSLGWCEEGEGFAYHPQTGGTGNNNGSSVGGTELGGGSTSLAPSLQVPRRHAVQYNFCIEDPYEENLNLGRHMGLTKTLRVQTEFYRGLLSLLKDGSKDACVFPLPSVSSVPELASSGLQREKGKGVIGQKDVAEEEQGEAGEEEDTTGSARRSLEGNKRETTLRQAMDDATVFTEGNGLLPISTFAHKVLYRLMVVSWREVAHSRRAYEERRRKEHLEKNSSLPSEKDKSKRPMAAEEIIRGPSIAKGEEPPCGDMNSVSTAPPGTPGTVAALASFSFTASTPGASTEREGDAPSSFPSSDAPDVSNKTTDGAKETGTATNEALTDGGRWGGVPEDVLRCALEKHAPIELKIGLKAWNWQQLIHRLGYKIHRHGVYPRREVGISSLVQGRIQEAGVGGVCSTTSSPPFSSSEMIGNTWSLREEEEQLETPTASELELNKEKELFSPYSRVPRGVIPSAHAREVMGVTGLSIPTPTLVSSSSLPSLSASSPTTSSSTSSSSPPSPTTAADALRHLPARGLTEEMQVHLSSGFLQLTPEWVPWSEPWAGNVIRTTTVSTNEAGPCSRESTEAKEVDEDARGGGSGVFHCTPKSSFYRTPFHTTVGMPSLSCGVNDCRRVTSKGHPSPYPTTGVHPYSCSAFLYSLFFLSFPAKISEPFLYAPLLTSWKTAYCPSPQQRPTYMKRSLMLATSRLVAVQRLLHFWR